MRLRLVGALAVVTAILVGIAIYQSASTKVPREGSAPPMATAVRVLRGPATISVVGDSTGNDENEWVALWAADLGRDRRVTLQRWLQGQYRPNPIEFGIRGDRVTIWNASLPGGAADWATDRLRLIQPERPDLVILSFGHNNVATDIGPQLEKLDGQLDDDVPVVLILQNPGLGSHKDTQAATLRAAEKWADSRGIPTIDVTAAFTDPEDQLRDDIHPNAAGSQLWFETVARALDTQPGQR